MTTGEKLDDRCNRDVNGAQRRRVAFYEPTEAYAANLWVFTVAGLWPAAIKPPTLRRIYKFYGFCTTTFLTVVYFATEFVHLATIWGDIEKMVDTAFLTLTHVANAAKLACLLIHRDKIELMLESLKTPVFSPRSEKHQEILRRIAAGSKKFSGYFLSGAICCTVTWAVYPLIDNSQAKILPFVTWFPYNTTTSPNYEYTYVYQTTAVFLNATTNCALDTFISELIRTMSGQVELLKVDLRSLTDDVTAMQDRTRAEKVPSVRGNVRNMAPDSREFHEALCERTIACVEHYSAIIRYINDVRDIFQYGILVQFMASTFLLCLGCYMLTLVSPKTVQFYSIVLYEACLLFEIFCYCWRSDEVLVKTTELVDAAYECEWTTCPKSFGKSLSIMMSRMQRPVVLSIIGIIPLSLKTFIEIVKSGYSFFVVLKQMQEQET